MVMLWLVKTQMSAAMFKAVSAISRADRSVFNSIALGCGLSVGATGTHGNQAVFRLNHVAVAGNDQGGVFVGDREHGFKAAEGAIGAPFFGQFDGGANQMALMLLKLAFETFEEGEGIGGGPGETGDHFAVVQAAHFLRIAFHDGIAERNLAVAGHDDFAVAAH